jgi:hypothetical protein
MAHNPWGAYRRTLTGLLEGVSDDAACRESARGENHDWMVFTTYVEDVSIGVFCRRCGCDGVIRKPTRADWMRAFDAPNNPYPWRNGHAVRFIGRRLRQWREELAYLKTGGAR